MNDIAAQINAFNAGRDPERLALKLAKMRSDPFVFLRGSCHLFYARLPALEVLQQAPLAWVCGDLHLENFGSYKGDNRLVYFDINDFDEATLAPCTWDLVRFLASVRLGAASLAVDVQDAEFLCNCFVDAYAAALAGGKARWVERETAEGLVRDLLDDLQGRKRPAYLDTRSVSHGKRRRLRLDNGKALPASEAQAASVRAFMAQFAATQPRPEFFKVLDVARRIAGTGSLGQDRFIVLVEGKDSPDGNYLLDLKLTQPSSLPQDWAKASTRWASESERVVSLQSRMQAVPMAFLNAVQLDGQPYILRGLQPSEDRVALNRWNGKLRRLEEVLRLMGQVTAWAHWRGSGRGGSAIGDELVDFGQQTAWRPALLAAARDCAQQVEGDWQSWVKVSEG